MATYTIFYSWQSDTNRTHNWDFIHHALERAVATVSADPETKDHPKVDFGMERVPGSPEVATIMFRKIKESAIFVGDVSIVGQIPQIAGSPKKTSNPNVLLEMGFAAGTIGWSRIICVMNETLGKVDKLPIDVRNRRFPIRYKLGEDNMAEAEAIGADLTKNLEQAIRAVVYSDYDALHEAERRLESNCLHIIGFYRVVPWFHSDPPGTFRVGSSNGIDTVVLNAAVPRLLDIGLSYCHFDSSVGKYAYHWTFLGKRYIEWKWPGTVQKWQFP